jgi:hypothetical protein
MVMTRSLRYKRSPANHGRRRQHPVLRIDHEKLQLVEAPEVDFGQPVLRLAGLVLHFKPQPVGLADVRSLIRPKLGTGLAIG